MAKPQVEVCRLPAVQPPQPPQPSQLLSAADPAARQAALTAAALAEPVRILELVEQMVGYAERFSRCRDVTFRRTAFMGQDLPQVEGHGQSAEEGGGPAGEWPQVPGVLTEGPVPPCSLCSSAVPPTCMRACTTWPCDCHVIARASVLAVVLPDRRHLRNEVVH